MVTVAAFTCGLLVGFVTAHLYGFVERKRAEARVIKCVNDMAAEIDQRSFTIHRGF